jgi:hypothetical protein
MIEINNEHRLKDEKLPLLKKLAQNNITGIRKEVEENETEVDVRLTRRNAERVRSLKQTEVILK